MRKLYALALLVVLSACGTFRGVEEFGAFTDAFEKSRVASEVVIDRIAVAERKLWRLCTNFEEIEDESDCIAFDDEDDYAFKVSHARYLAEAGDPPIAGSVRRALTATGAYVGALNGLAAGQTAEQMAGQLGQLVALASTASAAIVPVGGAGALAGISGAASDINDDVAALGGPIGALIGFQTRAAFREELLANEASILAALDGVIEATPDLNDMLLAFATIGARSQAQLEAAAAQSEENLRLIATWVVMLQATRDALGGAVAAVNGESGGVANFIATTTVLTEAARETREVLSGAPQ